MEGGVAHTESWVLCKPRITLQECLSLLEISIASCRNQSLTGCRATKGIAHPNNSPPLLEQLPCCLSTTCSCTCFGYPWQMPSSSTNAGMKRKMKTRMLRMGGGSASCFCIVGQLALHSLWYHLFMEMGNYAAHCQDPNPSPCRRLWSKLNCSISSCFQESLPQQLIPQRVSSCWLRSAEANKQARAPNWNRKRGYKSELYSKKTGKWMGGWGVPAIYLPTDRATAASKVVVVVYLRNGNERNCLWKPKTPPK